MHVATLHAWLAASCSNASLQAGLTPCRAPGWPSLRRPPAGTAARALAHNGPSCWPSLRRPSSPWYVCAFQPLALAAPLGAHQRLSHQAHPTGFTLVGGVCFVQERVFRLITQALLCVISLCISHLCTHVCVTHTHECAHLLCARIASPPASNPRTPTVRTRHCTHTRH